jgi:hypothetical protein
MLDGGRLLTEVPNPIVKQTYHREWREDVSLDCFPVERSDAGSGPLQQMNMASGDCYLCIIRLGRTQYSTMSASNANDAGSGATRIRTSSVYSLV